MNAISAPDVVHQLIAVGRYLGDRGLLPASSGNLSARVGRDQVAITRTGAEKAELTVDDIALIDLNSPPPPGTSAETGLHLAQSLCRSVHLTCCLLSACSHGMP